MPSGVEHKVTTNSEQQAGDTSSEDSFLWGGIKRVKNKLSSVSSSVTKMFGTSTQYQALSEELDQASSGSHSTHISDKKRIDILDIGVTRSHSRSSFEEKSEIEEIDSIANSLKEQVVAILKLSLIQNDEVTASVETSSVKTEDEGTESASIEDDNGTESIEEKVGETVRTSFLEKLQQFLEKFGINPETEATRLEENNHKMLEEIYVIAEVVGTVARKELESLIQSGSNLPEELGIIVQSESKLRLSLYLQEQIIAAQNREKLKTADANTAKLNQLEQNLANIVADKHQLAEVAEQQLAQLRQQLASSEARKKEAEAGAKQAKVQLSETTELLTEAQRLARIAEEQLNETAKLLDETRERAIKAENQSASLKARAIKAAQQDEATKHQLEQLRQQLALSNKLVEEVEARAIKSEEKFAEANGIVSNVEAISAKLTQAEKQLEEITAVNQQVEVAAEKNSEQLRKKLALSEARAKEAEARAKQAEVQLIDIVNQARTRENQLKKQLFTTQNNESNALATITLLNTEHSRLGESYDRLQKELAKVSADLAALSKPKSKAEDQRSAKPSAMGAVQENSDEGFEEMHRNLERSSFQVVMPRATNFMGLSLNQKNKPITAPPVPATMFSLKTPSTTDLSAKSSPGQERLSVDLGVSSSNPVGVQPRGEGFNLAGVKSSSSISGLSPDIKGRNLTEAEKLYILEIFTNPNLPAKEMEKRKREVDNCLTKQQKTQVFNLSCNYAKAKPRS